MSQFIPTCRSPMTNMSSTVTMTLLRSSISLNSHDATSRRPFSSTTPAAPYRPMVEYVSTRASANRHASHGRARQYSGPSTTGSAQPAARRGRRGSLQIGDDLRRLDPGPVLAHCVHQLPARAEVVVETALGPPRSRQSRSMRTPPSPSATSASMAATTQSDLERAFVFRQFGCACINRTYRTVWYVVTRGLDMP